MTNLSTAKTMLTVSTVMIAILVVILVVVVVLWMHAEVRAKRELEEMHARMLFKNSRIATSSGETKKGDNFYFTYGTAPEYPFCGGWTLIVAEDWDAAEAAFRIYHKGESYAFAYTQDAMEKTGMLLSGNAGAFCHEKIIIEKTLHPGDRAE